VENVVWEAGELKENIYKHSQHSRGETCRGGNQPVIGNIAISTFVVQLFALGASPVHRCWQRMER